MAFEHILKSIFAISLVNFASGSICCTPEQWEGHLFVEQTIFPFELYINSWINISYDFTNSRVVINESYVMKTPMANQHRKTGRTLFINDFKNNVAYELDDEKKCVKSSSSSQMPGACINDEAKLMQKGKVGNDIETMTYNMSFGITPFDNIRATIEHDSCLPVSLQVLNQVLIMKANVFKITKGIKDDRVFEIPPQCKNATSSQRIHKIWYPFVSSKMDFV